MEKRIFDLIGSIDFGEIDGYGDPNLEKYFIDDDYWNRVVNDKVFFVVGKKGTGKSSIYKAIENMSSKKGALVNNTDFGEFPFRKLMELSDESFSMPNQYQTVWKNLILQLFSKLVASSQNDENNEYKKELEKYVEAYIGTSISDLAKKIVTHTNKKDTNLLLKSFSIGKEVTSQSTYDYSSPIDINELNTMLSDLLLQFFKTSDNSTKYIIQFDRLDDNYNQYQDLEQYFHLLISLCKVTYSLNQKFRSYGINNAKIIIYIRSDILREIAKRDPESARWDDFKHIINWGANSVIREWETSKLYSLINKRIQTSSYNLKSRTFNDIFYFDDNNSDNVFVKILVDSMFRPRNLIMLSKILQKNIIERGYCDSSVYRVAQKEYGNWLFNSEIANEINPILKGDFTTVKELLSLCGAAPLTVGQFKMKYNSLNRKISLSPEELLGYLYDAGVIENCWRDKDDKLLHKSVFRNEGDFDRGLQIVITPCVWRGLTA